MAGFNESILQRAQNINSAAGYLRALTEKAAREFTVGPMLMAALEGKWRPSAAGDRNM